MKNHHIFMKCTVVLMFALCMTVHSYHCGRRSIHTSRIRDSRTIRLQSSSSAALPPSQPVTATTTAVETAARKKRVPKWYSPQGLDGEWRTEVLAGSVVALATIPTSVAYSSIIGLNPLIGIWSSIFVGLLLALVGGGPGVIAGAAGVVAIPMAKLLSVSSPAYMGAAVIAAGLLEILFGISKLGKYADAITEPVIVGFLNAFALFLFKSQIKTFQTLPGAWMQGPLLYYTLSATIISAATIHVSPKVLPKLPSSFVGLLVSSVIAILLKFPIKSLCDVAGKATFAGGLSSLPTWIGAPAVPLTMNTLSIIAPTVLGVTIISILETLLASRIACDIYRCRVDVFEEGNPDRMIIGLGVGNALSSLFGGFGGCGLIPNTLLNGKSGGRGYLSSLSYALFLSLSVLLFAPIIGTIPVASLSGLMLTVAFSTFDFKETSKLFKHAMNGKLQDFFDLLGMLVTMVTCFKVDMGLGVFSGFLVTKFPFFINKMRNKFTPKYSI